MNVVIPFAPTSASSEPLRACIEQAAAKSHVNEFVTALVLSYFWEAVADQLSLGRAVRIPGFGCFGVRMHRPPSDWMIGPRCYPAFAASRGFRQEVSFSCPPNAPAVAALFRYRKHHYPSSKPERNRERVFTAQMAFRDQIHAQARRSGWDLEV